MQKTQTSQARNTPRPPNKSEREQLAEWLCQQGHDSDEAVLAASICYVAVYDHYMTDCPGYVGKLMSIVWGGSPSFFDVFIWENDKLVRSPRDYDDCQCRQYRSPRALCSRCCMKDSQHSVPMPITQAASAGDTCTRCSRSANGDLCRSCILAEHAMQAFWSVIEKQFPQAKFGDLSVEKTMAFDKAATDAVEEWILNNVPSADGSPVRSEFA